MNSRLQCNGNLHFNLVESCKALWKWNKISVFNKLQQYYPLQEVVFDVFAILWYIIHDVSQKPNEIWKRFIESIFISDRERSIVRYNLNLLWQPCHKARFELRVVEIVFFINKRIIIQLEH